MLNKIYLIKTLTTWMMDELLAISLETKYSIILLRDPLPVYKTYIDQLKLRGINILIKPYKYNHILEKIYFIFKFTVRNIGKMIGGYNIVIILKSIYWYFRLDSSIFNKKPLSIHAQYATQAAVISYMIKLYYKNDVEYYFTYHAHDIYFHNNWFSDLVKFSSRTFSISCYNINYVKNEYNNVQLNKIILSRLGVFQKNNIINMKSINDIKVIGLLSWFQYKKGINYLLYAFKKLNINYPGEYRLILAGDGPAKKSILDYIDKNGMKNITDYVGVIKESSKKQFYNSINVFVLPSITVKNDKDGLPVVLMEAISYGVPIITTKISGLPEICINNYNGILINEKSSDEIYDAIIKMFQSSTKYNHYCLNAVSISSKYNIVQNTHYKLEKMKWI